MGEPAVEIRPGMRQTLGGFVTLTVDRELRGCIGEIDPRREIWRVVREQTVNAALRDPRFPPVTPVEAARIRIEISALTPSRPVASYREIVVGRHGMTLSKHGCSAVFLPQVATEQGWDLATTLSHLARKAGLPGDAWQDGATFTVFEAQVFHEPDDGAEPFIIAPNGEALEKARELLKNKKAQSSAWSRI
jgi:AmmeMemoRadiSam system protein A